MPQSVVVIVAHAFEARAAAAVGRGMERSDWGRWTLYRGDLWDLPYAVIRCGPGKAAAAAAAQAAAQFLEPVVLVSFGAAGCADVTVPEGSLTAATVVVDVAMAGVRDLPVPIPARFEPEPGFVAELLEVPGVTGATLACWEGHIASPAHPPPVPAGREPVVVDWESAGVARVAAMWGIAWGALKVVSDHGEDDRLCRLAVVARRPLPWGAEALRRACDRFVPRRLETQEVQVPEGKSDAHED